MGERGLMEEDWNDRGNCRKKIIVKWAQEDVETVYNLLNNNKAQDKKEMYRTALLVFGQIFQQ